MKEEDVKIPEQIQKQGEEADKLWEKQHGKTEIAPVNDEETKKEEERLAEEQAELKRVEEEEGVEKEEAVKAKKLEELPDFKHKFDVLQGKYDAEVPRLINENKRLRDHSLELSQIISTLQVEVEKIKTKEPEKKQDIKSFLTQEEVEELESVIEPSLLNKVIDGIVAERLRSVEQSVSSVQSTQIQTAEDIFWSKVDTIPNWQETNNDPAFKDEYLNSKAPYTNLTLRQILTDAQKRLDAGTVIEIFNNFPGTKKPKATLKPKISPQKGSGRIETSVTGKQWTIKEINDFYNDVQKGKYKGRDKERKQTEQDIWNAQKEGRIIKV